MQVAALLGAVVTFYLGKTVIYGFRYPGAPPLSVNISVLSMWCVLAVVGGVCFGLAFHHIGRDGWSGAVATAAAVGLLLADSARRSLRYLEVPPVLLVFVAIAVTVVLGLAKPTGRQAKRTALLVVPFAVFGLAVVSAPDLLQQLVVISGV